MLYTGGKVENIEKNRFRFLRRHIPFIDFSKKVVFKESCTNSSYQGNEFWVIFYASDNVNFCGRGKYFIKVNHENEESHLISKYKFNEIILIEL